jgi:WD40 repeat protein
LRASYGNALALAFAPDGNTLACGCGKDLWDPRGEVQLWDTATGKERGTLQGHTGAVTGLAFTADGKTLASGSYDRTVKLWDLTTGKPRTTLRGLDWSGPVHCVALTGDGKVLAMGDSYVHLFEAATAKRRASFLWAAGVHREFITAVAFSPDDRQLAEASWDGTVKLWDVRHLKESGPADDPIARLRGQKPWDERTAKLQFTLSEPVALVWSVAFAPDGKALAVGYQDGTVKLWDPATGRGRATFRHAAAVKSVAFAPDGRTLAAGCEDGTVRLWDAASGKERATLRHPDAVTAVVFAPDGKKLASAGRHTVKLWDVPAGTGGK